MLEWNALTAAQLNCLAGCRSSRWRRSWDPRAMHRVLRGRCSERGRQPAAGHARGGGGAWYGELV